MSPVRSSKVIAALLALRGRGGVIEPAAVVEAARPKSSPLHRFFDWDDSSAAAAWRIEQARKLLRITVTMLPLPGGNREVRAFVHLRSDGVGFRHMPAVLVDHSGRSELIANALEDMQAFRRKYQHLTELAEVVEAMTKAERRLLKGG